MPEFNPIRHQSDVDSAVVEILKRDPEMIPLADAVGTIPLRLREPGFEGLARIVVSQQVSVPSANAIWERFADILGDVTSQQVIENSDEDMLAAGLSRPKLRTIRAVATACEEGLALDQICRLRAKDARNQLVQIHGIGPWTADIFLMFCAGHPDIFPVGDIALQNVVQDVLGLRKRPTEKRLTVLARRWRPHRAVAARLLWAYYGLQKSRSVGSPIDAKQSKIPV